jgi:hypothetical protein
MTPTLSLPLVLSSMVEQLMRGATHRDSLRYATGQAVVQSFFAPDELVRHLGTMGFRHIEDLDGEQINARYFANRTDRLRVADGLGRLLCARG